MLKVLQILGLQLTIENESQSFFLTCQNSPLKHLFQIKKIKTIFLQHKICKCLVEIWGFPGGSALKNWPANAGDTGSVPGSGRFSGERNGNHCSILAREIPWTEESSGLQSKGSQRVKYDLVTEQQQSWGYIWLSSQF